MDQQTARRKAQDLLNQMTIEEKIAQMTQISYAHCTREEALAWAERGVGSFLHVLGDDARALPQAARGCTFRFSLASTRCTVTASMSTRPSSPPSCPWPAASARKRWSRLAAPPQRK